MAWFPDLSPCTYFEFELDKPLLAVGWLENGKPFSTGRVTADFFEHLCALLVDPWVRYAFFGPHACDFCQFTALGQMHFREYTINVGNKNLFVPDRKVLYVMPSLAAHYIDAHGYAPPREFIDAVMSCPPMRSMEYLRALKAVAPSALIGEGSDDAPRA
jgi:hypothetical protein